MAAASAVSYAVEKKTALKWFVSYLKNRTQSVKVSGFQSEKGFLQFGVPRGSI